jgi:NAD(P)-dependent dehydrogenase (short-subunit alcohol dehydrogenase family)
MNGERELEMAEADLAAARQELAEAGRNVEKAAEKIEAVIEEEKHPHQFEVTVLYNGVPKKFDVRRDELVQRLLDQARQAFGPINNVHLLGLFTKDGVELKDDQTIETAGVKPHEVLLLRPSTVRGG